MKVITSRYLRDIGACQGAREQFKKELNGGHSLSVSRVFTRLKQINRLDWANWLIVRLMTREQQIRYAIYAAEQVIELYEEKYPEDKRPRQAIEAARLCLDNPSEENKAAAWAAAGSAAESAWSAAESAARAAESAAEYAARSAAESAARAAESAAESAWSAAWSAAWAAWAAAWAAAESAARSAAALKKMQLRIINYGLMLIGISAPKREANP